MSKLSLLYVVSSLNIYDLVTFQCMISLPLLPLLIMKSTFLVLQSDYLR